MLSASAWATPPTRTELIENLVSGVGTSVIKVAVFHPIAERNLRIDRYNPSNVGILEDYLYHQIRSRECDCMANLAILKL